MTDDRKKVFAFERQTGHDSAVVVINKKDKPVNITLPVQKGIDRLQDEISGEAFEVKKEKLKLSIPAHSGRIFLTFQ